MPIESRIELANLFDGLPDCALVDEKTVAAVLSTSIRTLQADRTAKRGLPYVKQGRSVRYRKRDVVATMVPGYASAG